MIQPHELDEEIYMGYHTPGVQLFNRERHNRGLIGIQNGHTSNSAN